MPLYAYRCTKCGHRFEKIQNFNATPESECPKCQGVLERPLTAPALQFKGAGWYVNDYAPKSAAGSAGDNTSDSNSSDTKVAGADSKGDTKKSDTKPAASDSSAKSGSSESSATSTSTDSAAKSTTPPSST